MCGIAGIVGPAIEAGVIQRMTTAIAHRGPDSDGFYEEGEVHLGHRRLSIIDTSDRGRQPMEDVTGRYVLIHNGEIYNYQALKDQLQYDWQTGTDTEVILAAYHQWGPACLDRFVGMFAFAIWDKQLQKLFVARDRMGIKPLYWHQSHGRFAFASEVRSLLASQKFEAHLDMQGLQSYLMYQTTYGAGTLVQEINLLPAGHYAIWEAGRLDIHCWWDLWKQSQHRASELSVDAIRAEVRRLMEQSIARRLVADVPVGAFLSGGIDSSAVVALMAQASSQPVDTFSIVFAEKEYDESQWSQLIATQYATRHHPILLKPNDFLEALPAALAAMDHPSGDGINTFVVSQLTRAQGIKVALSGLGGDELFAGYPIFQSLPQILRSSALKLPYFLRQPMSALYGSLKSGREAEKKAALLAMPQVNLESVYQIYRTIYDSTTTKELIGRVSGGMHPLAGILAQSAAQRRSLPQLSQIGGLDINSYTQSVLLRDADQMSMAHALEIRVPFFDHDLVEFVMGIPDSIKGGGYPKHLLVASLGDLLPPALVHRPKMGFVFPWEQWLRGELRSFCDARIQAFAQRGSLAQPERLLRIWKEFQAGQGPWLWTHIWLPVVLEDWLQRNGLNA